jgi:glycosyltransferase involved in cell wall biosynthesis
MQIINIVENLNKGAVENWLINVFINSRKFRPDWHWTFYCILGKEGRLDEKVRNAGGEIIFAPVSISQKNDFLQHLRSTLKTGHYDVIHSHHDYLSGFYLLASAGIIFKKRILHVHNTDKALPVGNALLHKALLGPFKKLGFYFSSTIVGISKNTLQEFVGKYPVRNKDLKILYYGLDLNTYAHSIDMSLLKQELGLPEDSKLMLFAGRMNTFKNPLFVIDILEEISKVRNDVYALFVGQGDLVEEVSQRAKRLHVNDHVRLLGWRSDLAGIFQSVDVFVFPRVEYPKEGLGLVVVEAQAAGLPMVLSHGIVHDAIVIDELAHFIPLKDNPKTWANKVLEILDAPAPSRTLAFSKMQQSPFELETATRNLLALYEG